MQRKKRLGLQVQPAVIYQIAPMLPVQANPYFMWNSGEGYPNPHGGPQKKVSRFADDGA
jgi:hypothetical protein